MRDLRSLRERWQTTEADAVPAFNQMTIQESLQIWLGLQQAFEAQLLESAPYFTEQRRDALAALQERLKRLADWQVLNERSILRDHEAANSA